MIKIFKNMNSEINDFNINTENFLNKITNK